MEDHKPKHLKLPGIAQRIAEKQQQREREAAPFEKHPMAEDKYKIASIAVNCKTVGKMEVRETVPGHVILVSPDCAKR